MKVDILLSGAGGQGLMSLGKLIANVAVAEGKFAAYLPSYGAEVRGGTAYCFVKISDTPIQSPLVTEPDVAILLNQQSVDKFKKIITRKCTLILNSDLMIEKPRTPAAKMFYLPLNKLAIECGNIKCANMVALGALINFKPDILGEDGIINFLKEIFSSNTLLIDTNVKALSKGREAARL
ncbi:MAG: 2-oxoacid:acceptor oxidoreductase family protein [Candidatus Omnitrophica bacterium]|nr:2-oxoacid:acceptor oxidoreductase family protein [Candidatus Omnitrophota bacterium]